MLNKHFLIYNFKGGLSTTIDQKISQRRRNNSIVDKIGIKFI